MGIFSALTSIFGIVGKGWEKYQERKSAEHDVKIAQLQAEKELALATVKARAELGHTQIRATGKYFKYFTFFMWFGPFMVSVFLPSYGVAIFENLNQLPEWYVQSTMVIMFAIWGIQAGRESISHIFSGLGSFFNEKRKMRLHKKVFYDTLRSTKGTISQKEVELYEKALNNMGLNDDERTD